MKNKTQAMDQPSPTRNLDWMYQEQEDDFLMGKTPNSLPDIWEDEE